MQESGLRQSAQISFYTFIPQKEWWIFGIRGLFAFFFGVIAVFMPISAAIVTTIIFGIYAIVDGIFYLITNLRQPFEGWQRTSLILSSIINIIIGLLILFSPAIASISLADFLWIMVATWVLLTGVSEIVTVVQLPRMQGKRLLLLRGSLFILSGIGLLLVLWLNPITGLVTLGLFIGANSLASGALLLSIALMLLRQKKHLKQDMTRYE